MRRRALALGAALLSALATACGGDDEPANDALPARTLVTADWMNRSLSVFDLDALVEGRTDTPLHAIDLGAWSPGPIEVEVTPDGRTALVAIGPAFLDGLGPLLDLPEVPAGGALLVVDLEARAVRAEVSVSDAPLGLAIAPDGKHAFAALYGEAPTRGRALAVLDLEAGALVEEIEVGACPEQVTLDAGGAIGILSVAGEGAVHLFDTADPSQLSPPLSPSSDPSDVAFVEGTARAVVANSLGLAGYSVLDVSSPLAPVVLEGVSLPGGPPYGATAVPGSTHVLLTQSVAIPAAVVRIDAGSDPSSVAGSFELGNTAPDFALGVAVTPEGKHAFVALPSDRSLSVLDLDTGAVRALRWLEEPGPTYAALAIRASAAAP